MNQKLNYRKEEKNVLYVSSKMPVIHHITILERLINKGNKQIVILARGVAIENAITTVLTAKRMYFKNLLIQNIEIYEDEVEKDDFVSSIKITLGVDKNVNK